MQTFARWVYHEDTYVIEIYQALLSVLWGGWLLAPWPTFPSTPTFRVMALLMPEELWGGMLICVGLLHGCGLARRSLSVRRASILLGFAIWVAISTAIVSANWRTTATITYPWVAINYALVYWRVGYRNHV